MRHDWATGLTDSEPSTGNFRPESLLCLRGPPAWNAPCSALSQPVQPLSRVWLFATPWTTARQASLSITDSRSPPKPMCIESVMPSNHLIFYCPLLLLPSIFPSIRVFSKWVSSSHQVAKVLEFLNKVKSFGVRFSAFCSYDTIPLEQNFWFTLPELGARQWRSHGVTSRHLEQGAEWEQYPLVFPACLSCVGHSYGKKFRWGFWSLIFLGLWCLW